MKQQYEGNDLHELVDRGREQGYLTFDQVNDFLPQGVASATDLRAILTNFEDMDIKVLDEVPSGESDGDTEMEAGEEPDKTAEVETPMDSPGEAANPVRLYLKEMGNFHLLSREQEVEIAKRVEAGENEVEDVVLRSPVTLDFVIKMGEEVALGEADLRDIFEENEESSSETDEEREPEANEKQLKKLETSVKKLTSLRARVEDAEAKLLKEKAKGPNRAKLEKSLFRLKESVKEELAGMELSHRLEAAVIGEMRRLLKETRDAQRLIGHYEEATGRSRTQILCEASEADDRRHVLKADGTRENLLDIATREQTRKVLATLSPREETILRMRFGIERKTDHTLEEVGNQFAVTRERIRQIEAKALRKLRQIGRTRNPELRFTGVRLAVR